MHLADVASYSQAQNRVAQLYADPETWTRKAILNVASAGQFSSDVTISHYAADFWDAKSCPIS
jgi:starch phosphorylase